LNGDTALASLLLLALTDAIPYEKPYNIALQIYFTLFSIKFDVLKLDTAQKMYSVNKG